MPENMQEELSALLDGELDPERVDAVLDALARDPHLQADWADWLAQGDRLRGEPGVSRTFMKRFSERLAAEPVIIAPHRVAWRRRLIPLALAASVSFVVVSVWQISWLGATAPTMQAEREDRALRAYLAAHLEDAGNPLAEQTVVAVAFESGENR
jgi:sigma-E factor negative regulatory protein RseA